MKTNPLGRFSVVFLLLLSSQAFSDDYTVQILYKGKTEWVDYSRHFDHYDDKGNPVPPTAKQHAEEDSRKLVSGEVGGDDIERVRIIHTGSGKVVEDPADPNQPQKVVPRVNPALAAQQAELAQIQTEWKYLLEWQAILTQTQQRLQRQDNTIKSQGDSLRENSMAISNATTALTNYTINWRCQNGETLHSCRCGASAGSIQYVQAEKARIDRMTSFQKLRTQQWKNLRTRNSQDYEKFRSSVNKYTERETALNQRVQAYEQRYGVRLQR